MVANLLKLLIIEESLTDAELVVKFLKRSGWHINSTAVDSRKALIETIQQSNFDVYYQTIHSRNSVLPRRSG